MTLESRVRFSRWLLIVLGFWLLGYSPTLWAEDHYYLLIFGHESSPKRNKWTHSYATFVKVQGNGVEGCPYIIEHHTISWLPQNLNLEIWNILPRPGINLDLHTTLQLATQSCKRISLWGPFEIQPELYRRALRKIAFLNSGKIRYDALDLIYRTETISCNCVHAICDIDTDRGKLRVGPRNYGIMASYILTLFFQRWMINSCTMHPWLIDYLGLHNYPICYRNLADGPPVPWNGRGTNLHRLR